MKPDRLNAFTDGVIAIIITIMVLEMRVPDGSGLAALRPEMPIFAAYVLSFINVGIYWNNHHHMMQTAKRVDGRVLWANLGLLFWLSLFPFVIRWIDEARRRRLCRWRRSAFVLIMAAHVLSPARAGADCGRGRGLDGAKAWAGAARNG